MSVFLLLSAGMLLLYGGAELLVRGGASFALRAGLSPLVIGLTVIAFGTSSPELVVCLQAASRDQGGIVLGNILGSNVANIALVLGLTAIICPIRVQQQAIKREVPIVLAASLLLFFLFWNDRLYRIEGLLLIGLLIVYLVLSVRSAKKGSPESVVLPKGTDSLSLSIGLIVVGFALLVPGAHFFLRGATSLARYVGISDLVIGLTVVAIGTSLPEIATSIVAAARGKIDLAVGNALGSNIFNIFFILGATALFFAIDGSQVHWMDWTMMLGVALISLPIMRSGLVISRLEGVGLVLAYILYLVSLVLRSG